MPEENTGQGQKAITTAISLYPQHDEIVRQFAAETHRRYSNALQFIIEDWERMNRAAAESASPEPEPLR